EEHRAVHRLRRGDVRARRRGVHPGGPGLAAARAGAAGIDLHELSRRLLPVLTARVAGRRTPRPATRRFPANVLDTTTRIGTPEGIELTLRVAGPVPRALAWLVDLLIRGVLLSGIGFVAGMLGVMGQGVFLLSLLALEWLYPAWFEAMRGGATPGKRAFGLVVLHDDGTPVRWSAALTRNLLLALDFLPFGYFLGYC